MLVEAKKKKKSERQETVGSFKMSNPPLAYHNEIEKF